jgi:protocatechuate 3,4-dioxygenase alpha subunit
MQCVDRLHETASQTAGPYVHIGCMPNYSSIPSVYARDLGDVMVDDKTTGTRISIRGRVFDGTGSILKDAMVELWQADASGRFGTSDPRGAGDPHFRGFARRACDDTNGFWHVDTIKPGAVPYPDGRTMAPHVLLWVVARGINIGLQTRLYFPDEAEANANDPVLARIEHRNRIASLIARQDADFMYHFDINLQGSEETIFFDV